jgi:uncharacterized protein
VNTSAPSKRSPLEFFLLVFAFSIPFWLIGAIASQGLPLLMNLSVSALSFVCPIAAALILVYRENKLIGIKLFRRTLDYKRIKPKIWFVPIIFFVAGYISTVVWSHAPDRATTSLTSHFISNDTDTFCWVLNHCLK